MGLVQIGGEIRATPLNQNFQYLDGKHLYGDDAAKPSPAQIGRLYVALDTGIIYADIGTAWIPVGGGSVPAHASTHATGGSDPLTPADIGAASQVDFAAHLAEKATDTVLGHVMVDNKTIKAADGVISTKFRGALVNLTANQAIASETATLIAWSGAAYDTDGFFSSSNPTRLTVPSGVSKVVVKAHVVWDPNDTGRRFVHIMKNGSAGYNGRPSDVRMAATDSNQSTAQVITSGVIDVSPGDHFEVRVYQSSGASLNVQGGVGNSWFALEVVG